MKPFVKSVAALGVIGALALTVATPSEARSRWAPAAAGFAVGAIVGAAVANSNGRYYDGYAYESYPYSPSYGYDAYGYEPRTYVVPSYRYGPVYENPRERQLRGTDY